MSAIELNQKLADLSEEIRQINEQTKILTERRKSVLSELDEDAGRTIRQQLQELQGRLEDITIMKTAVEGKLQVYKKRWQEAAKVREEISRNWQDIRPLFSNLIQVQSALKENVSKIIALQQQIRGLAENHRALIAEHFEPPTVPYLVEFGTLANASLQPLQAWVYESQQERANRLEAERLRREKPNRDLIERAKLYKPICDGCRANDQVTFSDVYKFSGSYLESGGFRIFWHCDRCNARIERTPQQLNAEMKQSTKPKEGREQ